MKGVILAGGSGSRLGHLTKITNKHLLPVGKYPMIYHPISKLVEAGITEILVVTGCEHIGSIVGYLGSGKGFGCDITYRIQDEAGGIAEALYLAKDFAGNSPVCVLLGDNIFSSSLSQHAQSFERQHESLGFGAMVLLYGFEKNASHKSRFGVAYVDREDPVNLVRKIVEKPTEQEIIGNSKEFDSGIVTGIYFYDSTVFDKIEKVTYSSRGEKEITDVNNLYLVVHKLKSAELTGNWTDAGTFSSLQRANKMFEEVE